MPATAIALTLAIVTQDQSALRAAARDTAAEQAVLWQGDALEIRGEKGDFLQVYDHRRERAGYVRATQVRIQSLAPEGAPELLAVVRFLRDSPGSEALGIAYAAAYLRAAPAAAIDGEAFDALGTMADRLARQASSGRPGKLGEAIAAHVEVVSNYGIKLMTFERDGQVQLCYDGDAHRRVLALHSTELQKAHAVLALTRHDCVPPDLTPQARFELDNQRAELLYRVTSVDLSAVMRNRLHMRRAGVWAGLAWQRARRPDADTRAVQAAARRALEELAAVDKSELTESDAIAYADAGIRVGASRWAAEVVSPEPTAGPRNPSKLAISTSPGRPGETCVALTDATHDEKSPLASKCTYGTVWAASAVVEAGGGALTLAVQPMEAWREMWVFRRGSPGWTVDVVPPGLDPSAPAYVEFAGWVPGGRKMLAAREGRVDGHNRQSFELIDLATLEIEKRADKPDYLNTFRRWQSAAWKGATVSLR